MKDFVGRDIKVGDFLLQSFNLGRCAAMKFALVVKVSDNNIRVIGCEYYAADNDTEENYASIGYGVYNIQYGNRSYIIDRGEIPHEAVKALEEKREEIQ